MKAEEWEAILDVNYPQELIDNGVPGTVGTHIQLGLDAVAPGTLVICTLEGVSKNQAPVSFADVYREQLFGLCLHGDLPWVDLGGLKIGDQVGDTHQVVRELIAEIVGRGGFPLIIAPEHDLTVPMLRAFSDLEREVHLGILDQRLDLYPEETGLNSTNFLSKLLVEDYSYVYDFSVFGTQTYFINPFQMDVWKKCKFQMARYGELMNRWEENEPLLRDCSVFSADLSALRQSDMSCASNTPNGLSAWEFCQLGKYLGISDKMEGVGLFGLNTTISTSDALLLAEFTWTLAEGIQSRVNDYPIGGKASHRKFTVAIEHDLVPEIHFFQSLKSGRWWFEAPVNKSQRKQPIRQKWVSCSYSDFQSANENRIPDLWWRWLDKNS